MQHDDFDQTRYDAMSDKDKLGLLQQITDDFDDQINEVRSQIEDLEAQLGQMIRKQRPFLKEMVSIRLRT